MSNAIKTCNLSFKSGKKLLLDTINLLVPTGGIYGYLGKNGAGKSTTIKLLLGILSSPRNTIYYKDLEFNSNRYEILNKVGSLIESPAYYGNLSGYENLFYLKDIYNCSRQNIIDVLTQVHLLADKDKKVKKYSTGMKQRLGIAMALLNDPETLILDEPLNGLDPEGVYEMRELIIKLKNEGKTIFLSSHILSEIQKTCTHIGVLHNGRLLYQGDLSDLLASVPVEIIIHSQKDVSKIEKLCKEWMIEINYIKQEVISVTINKNLYDDFRQRLSVSEIDIRKVESSEKDLEEIYLKIIKQ